MNDTTGEMAFERREPVPAWQAWLETATLAAAMVAAGALLDGSDPFLLRRGFPWLALAPLLAGLRYGSVPALACAGAQALALAAAGRWGVVAPGSVPEIALGWLVAGFAAGGFRDAWGRRGRQLEALAEELRLRLEALAREHRALEASHDGLQRGAPGRPASLRDALDESRRQFEGAGAGSLEAMGGRILELFSRHGQACAATLHPLERDGRPGPAIASLGTERDAGDDPLVREAARTGEVVSLRDAGERTLALAAVPLVDAAGRVQAVVAIHEMPFLALHAETLDLLAVLGGHVGDLVSQALAPARRAERWARGPGRAPSEGAAATAGLGRRGLPQDARGVLEEASWRSA